MCEIAFDGRTIVLTYGGRITVESLLECMAAVAKQFRRYDAVVADYSQIEAFDLSAEDVQLIARAYEFSHHPRAIIAPQPHVYGMGRVFQAYVEVTQRVMPARVFRTRVEGIQWLEKVLHEDGNPGPVE